MSDHTAPERIWADPDHWIDHPPRLDADRPWEYAEYIRADLSVPRAEAVAALTAKDAEIARLEEAYRLEAMRRPDYTHEAFDAHLAALTGKENGDD